MPENQAEIDAHIAGQQGQEGAPRPLPEDRINLYPVLGKDFIVEIGEASTPSELVEVVKDYLAVKEGLIFGYDLWDLGNKEQRDYLQNMFLTVEGGTNRESFSYAESALLNQIQEPVRKIKKRARSEGKKRLDPNETKEVGEYTDILGVIQAREILDGAYRQRMNTCQVAEEGANLVSKDKHYQDGISPDRVVWEKLFQGEFGILVDRALRRIVASSLEVSEINGLRTRRGNREVFPGELQHSSWEGRDVYVNGINDSSVFKNWLENILEVTDGRMDVAWFAWRLALTWEIPAELGVHVDNRGRYEIANTPVGNDFFVWSDHLEAKRAYEYGLDSSQNRNRYSRYLTHSGYPTSLGKIQKIRTIDGVKIAEPLLGSFLRESDVKVTEYQTNPDGSFRLGNDQKPIPKLNNEGKIQIKRRSLWELWWEDGKRLSDLPWERDDEATGLGNDEFPAGSFGLWLLKRTRVFPVITDIRSRPSLRDITDPDFFGKRVRVWDKTFPPVLLDKEDRRYLEPIENPRAWWVLGLLVAHHPDRPETIPIVRSLGQELSGYGTFAPNEVWSKSEMGTETKNASVFTILNSAWRSGFLRKEDLDFIALSLGIKSQGRSSFDYSVVTKLEKGV